MHTHAGCYCQSESCSDGFLLQPQHDYTTFADPFTKFIWISNMNCMWKRYLVTERTWHLSTDKIMLFLKTIWWSVMSKPLAKHSQLNQKAVEIDRRACIAAYAFSGRWGVFSGWGMSISISLWIHSSLVFTNDTFVLTGDKVELSIVGWVQIMLFHKTI